MAWEDGLNEMVGVGQIETPPDMLTRDTPWGGAPTLTQAATTGFAGRPWTEMPTPPAPPTYQATERVYTGEPARGRFNSCSENNHQFECKHELRCSCGLVERLPLQLPEGL